MLLCILLRDAKYGITFDFLATSTPLGMTLRLIMWLCDFTCAFTVLPIPLTTSLQLLFILLLSFINCYFALLCNHRLPDFMSHVYTSWLLHFLTSWLHDLLLSCYRNILPDSMTSWFPNSMCSWLPNFITSWLHDSITSWLPDSMTSWLPDFMPSWLPDFLIS